MRLPPSSPEQLYDGEHNSTDRIARFGPFELNITKSELRRQNRPVNIRQQSLRILIYLVEHAGRSVSREELQATVWPSGTFIEFESGLYTAVNQTRQALGDSAGNPYFIETVPKVGYRFISPVQWEMPAAQELDRTTFESGVAAPGHEISKELPVPRSIFARAWVWVAVFVLVMSAAWLLRNRLHSGPPVLDHIHPFTAATGIQDHASFSPDGKTLAFEWSTPSSTRAGIYVQRLDASTPVRVSKGEHDGRHPIWSADGRQLAFLRRLDPAKFAIVSVSLTGAANERKLAEFPTDPREGNVWFDWSRDGKWFAVAEPGQAGRPLSIVLISSATGKRRTITTPPVGWRGDAGPVFSPDSTHVVFRRTMAESSVEDIYEVPLDGGEPKRLTFDNRMIKAYAFMPDGGLVFSSKRASSISMLWWLSPQRNRLEALTAPVVNATSPAVSRDGKHIAFSKVLFDVNIWRVNADGSGAATPLIDSELPDTGAQFSPDGHRLVFASERSGTNEIWVSDAQGANAVCLTDGRGAQLGNPRWSPDGQRIAFEWQPSGRSGIYLISSSGGTPRRLVADEYQNSVPSWSHDGRSIYFASSRSGERAIWKIPAEGGTAIQITKESAFAPRESPDGRYLYYFRSDVTGEIWRLALRDGIATGLESKVVTGLRPHDWGNWAPGNDGIYYIPEANRGPWSIQYLDFASGSVRTVYVLPKWPIYGNSGLTLSADGKTVLFAEIDQDGSNIFVQ